MALFSGIKGDIAGGHIPVIQVDIRAIGTRRQLLALFKTGQIRHGGGIVRQKAWVEIELRLRVKSR